MLMLPEYQSDLTPDELYQRFVVSVLEHLRNYTNKIKNLVPIQLEGYQATALLQTIALATDFDLNKIRDVLDKLKRSKGGHTETLLLLAEVDRILPTFIAENREKYTTVTPIGDSSEALLTAIDGLGFYETLYCDGERFSYNPENLKPSKTIWTINNSYDAPAFLGGNYVIFQPCVFNQEKNQYVKTPNAGIVNNFSVALKEKMPLIKLNMKGAPSIKEKSAHRSLNNIVLQEFFKHPDAPSFMIANITKWGTLLNRAKVVVICSKSPQLSNFLQSLRIKVSEAAREIISPIPKEEEFSQNPAGSLSDAEKVEERKQENIPEQNGLGLQVENQNPVIPNPVIPNQNVADKIVEKIKGVFNGQQVDLRLRLLIETHITQLELLGARNVESADLNVQIRSQLTKFCKEYEEVCLEVYTPGVMNLLSATLKELSKYPDVYPVDYRTEVKELGEENLIKALLLEVNDIVQDKNFWKANRNPTGIDKMTRINPTASEEDIDNLRNELKKFSKIANQRLNKRMVFNRQNSTIDFYKLLHEIDKELAFDNNSASLAELLIKLRKFDSQRKPILVRDTAEVNLQENSEFYKSINELFKRHYKPQKSYKYIYPDDKERLSHSQRYRSFITAVKENYSFLSEPQINTIFNTLLQRSNNEPSPKQDVKKIIDLIRTKILRLNGQGKVIHVVDGTPLKLPFAACEMLKKIDNPMEEKNSEFLNKLIDEAKKVGSGRSFTFFMNPAMQFYKWLSDIEKPSAEPKPAPANEGAAKDNRPGY